MQTVARPPADWEIKATRQSPMDQCTFEIGNAIWHPSKWGHLGRTDGGCGGVSLAVHYLHSRSLHLLVFRVGVVVGSHWATSECGMLIITNQVI